LFVRKGGASQKRLGNTGLEAASLTLEDVLRLTNALISWPSPHYYFNSKIQSKLLIFF